MNRFSPHLPALRAGPFLSRKRERMKVREVRGASLLKIISNSFFLAALSRNGRGENGDLQ